MRTRASLLEVEHISVHFGGVRALDDASLRVNPGEIVGLIGPNGAGKTTFFNCVSGVLKPDTGTVTFDGHDLGALPPHRRSRLGLARTFQNLQLFASMTVLEPGAVLLLVSRGVVEARCQGNEFGVEGVSATLEHVNAPSAQRLCVAILDSVERFMCAPPTHNDVTALALVRSNPQS